MLYDSVVPVVAEFGDALAGKAIVDISNPLDTDSYALVKTLSRGRHGAAYPDMTWEPKQSFTAVADYYATH